MSKGVSIGVLLVAGVLGSVTVWAQGAENRGAQWIKYRQSIYNVLGTNFGQLGAVVQNKAPFDAADFARRADRVAFMAGIAPEAFPAESASGAPTKAKGDIWRNKAEFDRLMKNMQDKTRALATASQGGQLDAIRPAFVAAAETCKACHDKFKDD